MRQNIYPTQLFIRRDKKTSGQTTNIIPIDSFNHVFAESISNVDIYTSDFKKTSTYAAFKIKEFAAMTNNQGTVFELSIYDLTRLFGDGLYFRYEGVRKSFSGSTTLSLTGSVNSYNTFSLTEWNILDGVISNFSMENAGKKNITLRFDAFITDTRDFYNPVYYLYDFFNSMRFSSKNWFTTTRVKDGSDTYMVLKGTDELKAAIGDLTELHIYMYAGGQ